MDIHKSCNRLRQELPVNLAQAIQIAQLTQIPSNVCPGCLTLEVVVLADMQYDADEGKCTLQLMTDKEPTKEQMVM